MKRTSKEAEVSRARAAGMAKATAGRARTFRDRSRDDDGGEAEIEEGLEDLANPLEYGDWDF